MQSLLRADLRRILNSHGNFLGYFVVLLVFAFLGSVGTQLLMRVVADATNNETLRVAMADGYASSLNILTSLTTFSFVSLISSWCVASICWSDMRAGFERTIVSSCGKKTYYTEKIVLALVLSTIFVVAGSLFAFVCASLMIGFTYASSIVSFLLWVVFCIILCWGCASFGLAILWLVRNSTVTFLVSLALATGILSGLLVMSFGAVPEVANFISTVKEWLPSGAFTVLETVTDGEFVVDAMACAHVLVPSAVCLAISYMVALNVLPKRDL